jgi:hypothetical protein
MDYIGNNYQNERKKEKKVSTIKNEQLQKTEEGIAKIHRKCQEGISWAYI